MIKNARQYQLTKTQRQRFETALLAAQKAAASGSGASELRQLEIDALRSQVETLTQEVQEYDALTSGRTKVLEATSFDDLPRLLIQARIAAGLSQKDLADRLGLKEQQVQRYEATDYESASLSRINEVVRALGLRIRKEILLPDAPVSLSTMWDRLNKIGLKREFVLSRLLPPSLATRTCDAERDQSDDASNVVFGIANAIGPIFGFAPTALLAGDPLVVPSLPAQSARFKLPARVRGGALAAYAVYVHYLALVVLGSTSGQRKRPVPDDWNDVRTSIVANYGVVNFHNALRYVWDLGVAVLPLNDAGLFHGACWRVDGRNVIVIKQKSRSDARWLIDLLHEFFHAMDYPEEANFAVVEDDEMSEARRNSDDEREATEFAADVVLDGRADELAELCAHLAQGEIPRLKSVVRQVAGQEGVSVGVLANYIAHRLALEGKDWWGTAQNLQESHDDPGGIARDELLGRMDFARLNLLDRDLLSRALAGAEEW
jgi:transcriptional regulator with XRE-family HTH domain